MKKNLRVIELGNPALRKKSLIIKNIKDKKIKNLISGMCTTLKELKGAGLAAPQVNKNLRLFVLSPDSGLGLSGSNVSGQFVVINPKIIEYSKSQDMDWEGCFSIPGIRAIVPRSRAIKVEYITLEGEKALKTLKDFTARAFQHEYDHLEGIVYLDRARSNKDIITEKEYQKLLKIK